MISRKQRDLDKAVTGNYLLAYVTCARYSNTRSCDFFILKMASTVFFLCVFVLSVTSTSEGK